MFDMPLLDNAEEDDLPMKHQKKTHHEIENEFCNLSATDTASPQTSKPGPRTKKTPWFLGYAGVG